MIKELFRTGSLENLLLVILIVCIIDIIVAIISLKKNDKINKTELYNHLIRTLTSCGFGIAIYIIFNLVYNLL